MLVSVGNLVESKGWADRPCGGKPCKPQLGGRHGSPLPIMTPRTFRTNSERLWVAGVLVCSARFSLWCRLVLLPLFSPPLLLSPRLCLIACPMTCGFAPVDACFLLPLLRVRTQADMYPRGCTAPSDARRNRIGHWRQRGTHIESPDQRMPVGGHWPDTCGRDVAECGRDVGAMWASRAQEGPLGGGSSAPCSTLGQP